MSQEWFYIKDGQQHGPFTSIEFKRLAKKGTIQPVDLVKTGEMKKWKAANVVKGLFSGKPVERQIPEEMPQLTSADEDSSSTLKSTLASGGKLAAVLGGLGGFAGDFLTPLAPLNGYLAAAAAIFCFIFALLWRRLTSDQRKKVESSDSASSHDFFILFVNCIRVLVCGSQDKWRKRGF